MSPISTTIPAGVLIVPLGVVDVCQAGTQRAQPQSKLTVPPRLGSRTSWPSPRSPASSPASSTIAATLAPVRFAIATVSPMWSAWPWVSRIASACDLVGADGGLRVAGQERIDQDRRAVVLQRDGGVAEEADGDWLMGLSPRRGSR